MIQSEGDVLVALILAVFVCPWVSLQEILNCLLNGHVGIKRTLDRLSGERISPSIFLQMMLQSLSLVGLPAIRGHWVLHELQSDPAGEIVGNAEDKLLISCLNECLQFGLLGLQGEGVVFVEVFLHLNQSYLVFLCGLYPGVPYILKPQIEEQFFSQVDVSADLLLQLDTFAAIESESFGQPGNGIFHFPYRVFLFSQLRQYLTAQQMPPNIGGIQLYCFLGIFERCFCSSNLLQALCSIGVEYALSRVYFDGATVPCHCLLVIPFLVGFIALNFPIQSSPLLHFFFLFLLRSFFGGLFAVPT